MHTTYRVMMPLDRKRFYITSTLNFIAYAAVSCVDKDANHSPKVKIKLQILMKAAKNWSLRMPTLHQTFMYMNLRERTVVPILRSNWRR